MGGCFPSKIPTPSQSPSETRTPTVTPKTPTPSPKTPTPSPKTPEPSPVPSVQFSSDTVEKIIDDRNDEHPVEKTEAGYPEATPPEKGSEEVRPKNNWFEDDSVENSSDEVVDLHEIEQINNDNQSDSDEMTLRPKPNQQKSKIIKRVSYKDIDEHAKKGTSALQGSFSALIEYLKQPIMNNDSNKELLTARALIVWLSQQDVDRTQYADSTIDTPRWLLQCLKEKKMTYATCYTRLCRKANLKCSLVKGWVKAASYQPGDNTAPSSMWTAVFVDGSWQLVQPFWICRALFGHSLGGWVKIEADGTTLREREQASEGVVRSTFQEYYFMPRPEHFIYECCAEDKSWQLLDPCDTVKSESQFLSMPYLLPPFFGLGLKLKSEKSCSLVSINGKSRIELNAKPSHAEKIELRYELFSKDITGESSKFTKEKQMSRMVFNNRVNERFEFDIRFQEVGEYKFVIYGGPYKSPSLRLCEFQIVCKSIDQACVPLPLACEEIGWGPGPASIEAGLLVPTRVGGFVEVENSKPRKTDIRFQIDEKRSRENNFSAKLYRSDGQQVNENTVECIMKNYMFSIIVTLPSEGEFGLTIICTKTSSTSIVCNYLLSTKKAKFVKANVRVAKRKLQEAIEVDVNMEHLKRKIQSIEEAIDKCVKARIDEDDEDFSAANTILIFLKLKDKLRDAILREHYGVAIKTLTVVSRYKYKDALRRQVKRVEEMIAKMSES